MSDLEIVSGIAKEAGELLQTYQKKLSNLKISSKTASRDLVTDADFESEKLIISLLKEKFPDSSCWSEETFSEEQGGDVVWCIDPLDGTVNFVQSLPFYAVSIARITKGVIDLGVVYVPELDWLFSASSDVPSSFNAEPITVSSTSSLKDAVLATGFPYRRHLLVDNNLENFNRLFLKQRGIRRMGAAAIDLCLVSCGRLDAFWELHLSPWDVAAGGYIVERAGGVVDTISSGGDWLRDKNILCGPLALVEELREELLRERSRDYPDVGYV